MTRALNFGAGPSALPTSVLEEATKGLLEYGNTGIGIAEISHRSKEFVTLIGDLEQSIRKQLDVPPTHQILFTQGGGTGQFSAVVYNMLARFRLLHPEVTEPAVDYVITGSWSKKAADEARRLGSSTVHVAADSRKFSKDGKSFDSIPPRDAYQFSENPALVYYCENETVDGVQFSANPQDATSFPFDLLPKNNLVPLVADHSSSFMSRPIPRLADHAIIYAGAQKNIGPAGLTILIVRQDCIVDVDAAAKLGAIPTPITMSYKAFADAKSLMNTPATLPIYIAYLVLKHMDSLGGLSYYETANHTKSDLVYSAISRGEAKGVYRLKVQDGARSKMNVVWDVVGDGAEARFLAEAEKRNLKALKGHRSVGGIRASLYNANTIEDTKTLVKLIDEFAEQETRA